MGGDTIYLGPTIRRINHSVWDHLYPIPSCTLQMRRHPSILRKGICPVGIIPMHGPVTDPPGERIAKVPSRVPMSYRG